MIDEHVRRKVGSLQSQLQAVLRLMAEFEQRVDNLELFLVEKEC